MFCFSGLQKNAVAIFLGGQNLKTLRAQAHKLNGLGNNIINKQEFGINQMSVCLKYPCRTVELCRINLFTFLL